MRLLSIFPLIWLFLVAPAAKAATGSAADSTLLKKVQTVTAAVGKMLVPDQRTDIFQFEVKDVNSPAVELETTLPAAAENLRTELAKSGFNVPLTVKMLPAEELQGKVYGIVRLSVSNNRKTPGNAAEMVTQMTLGTPVQILKKQHGYSLVRSPDRYISWVDNDAIAIMNSSEFENWQKAEKLLYAADFGFSYTEPNLNSLRVSDLVKGDIVVFLGKDKGFYKIGYPDHRIAYIPVKEAQDFKSWASKANPDADQILKTAKTLIGVPYLWGGTSIKGVDCSGFTKTSYFLNGIVLPRDASQQALVGEPIDIYEADTVNLAKCLKNLKAGDLLFFGRKVGQVEKVTHTAIYIGDGVFIQSAGMVRINSMVPTAADYADYQSRSLLSARRMLNSIGKPQITRIDQHPLYTTTKP